MPRPKKITNAHRADLLGEYVSATNEVDALKRDLGKAQQRVAVVWAKMEIHTNALRRRRKKRGA